MVIGVTGGYEKTLEIVGVGYRVAAKGSNLEFALGVQPPGHRRAAGRHHVRGRTPTRFVVRGIDKQKVGEVSAKIRKLRKPDPYKGKGVRYQGESSVARSERQGSR
jgi:large subunit ribosomal protein L6